MFALLALLLLAASTTTNSEAIPFRVIKEWKYLNFTWPSQDVLRTNLARGWYIPEHNLISGVGYFENHFYLALPRMHDGIPVTLARIPETGSGSPLLEPYPSWGMNTINDCNALQNVQNIEVDAEGKLWIIDGGRTATLARLQVVKCPPKILVHNIRTNTTEIIYPFPADVVSRETGFLYDLVVDRTDGGYAYITDNSARNPGIVVFSLQHLDSWRVSHNATMRAQPDATKFTIDGVDISTPVNIAGIALGSASASGDRVVYYSPMSSYHLFAINSSSLRNRSASFLVQDLGMRDSQTDGMVMDDKDVLYFGLLGNSSVAKWDTKTPFMRENHKIIANNPDYIQWPNSFAFDNKGDLILLTNKLQKYIYGKLDLNEVNFRLFAHRVGSNSYLFDPLKYTVETTEMATTEGDNHIHFHMVTSPKTTEAPVENVTTVVGVVVQHASSGVVYNGCLVLVTSAVLRFVIG